MSATAAVLALALGCGKPRTLSEPKPKPKPEPEPERGVVLVRVGAGAAPARAELQVGMEIREWRRAGAVSTTVVTSPFDLLEVEHEEVPRGDVELHLFAKGVDRWVAIPPGRWYLEARPPLEEAHRRAWEEAVAGEGSVAGRDALAVAATQLGERGRVLDAAWLQLRRAALADEGEEARSVEEAAVAALADVATSQTVGWTWWRIGVQRTDRGDYAAAIDALERALEAWHELPERLATGEVHFALGTAVGRSGDPVRQEAEHREALALRQRFAPESLAEARSWMRIGWALALQDEIVEALVAARRGRDLSARWVAEGFDHQDGELLLGIVHWFEEDWDIAEGYLREALRIIEVLDPTHESVQATLGNLGIVASSRGDLAASDEYHRRALERYEAAGARGIEVARVLNNLANNASDRRDFPAAVRFHERSLAIRERIDPGSLDVATALLNLGNMLAAQERYDEAEVHFRRALELQNRHVPGTRDVARTLGGLGKIRLRQGQLEEAETLVRRGLDLIERVDETSRLGATYYHRLAEIAAVRGDRAEAERLLGHADGMLEQLAPGTVDHALALHTLGLVQRDLGQPHEALATLTRATEALEVQLRSLGGSAEARASFRGAHLDLYRDQLELLVELGDPAAALRVLERSKARSLLVMLRERGVDLVGLAPPEQAHAVKELAAEYDDLQAELTESSVDDRDGLARRLADLRQEQSALWADIRLRSQTLRRVDSANPTTGPGEMLEEGTVALCYGVGEQRTHLFVVRSEGYLRHHVLPVGADDLRAKVDRFRLLVERLPPEGARDGHRQLAEELFDLLVRPAMPELERAERVLISPDGPLHLLPFAALVESDVEDSGRAEGRYFVAWKPLFQAASLTVFDELTRRPRATDARDALVAFGDPAGKVGEGDTALREVLGRQLSRLPFSRVEVEGLVELYGARGRGWLDAEASEERAKGLPTVLGSLHYATHAFVDHTSPLDSGLVLAASSDADGRWHNGVLQAWEIFQGLRFEAGLVTLSACETGGGPVVAGEGLLSLTRAFQVAGARSVVASLWEIADRSSAELMVEFYRHLKQGLDKPEALRAAQLELLAKEDVGHPYHWAAFQLYGDWR